MGHKAEILGVEPRRSDSKSEMLPITSYLIIIIQLYADAAGFEPATPGFGDQRSTRLSYAPKSFRPNTLGCRTEGTFFTAMGYKVESFPHSLMQILKAGGEGAN